MNDQEYIRNRFENDGLESPEGLSRDAVFDMLAAEDGRREHVQQAGREPAREHVQQTGHEATREHVQQAGHEPGHDPARKTIGSQPSNRRKWRRPLIAFAACACLALGLIPLMNAVMTPGTEDGQPDTDAAGLCRFSSYADLESKVRELTAENEQPPTFFSNGAREDMAAGDVVVDGITEDAESADSAEPGRSEQNSFDAGSSDQSDAGVTGPSPDDPQANILSTDGMQEKHESYEPKSEHSDTYTQVDGVDEADIVKTDGRFIYHVSAQENQVIITRAKDGKTSRVSAVSSHSGGMIHDIYIRGDLLAVIGEGEDDLTGGKASTEVTLYDITDRRHPAEKAHYAQMGDLLSSRLLDDRLCLVTCQRIYTDVPVSRIPGYSLNDEPANVPIEDIRYLPETDNPVYSIIGMISLTDGELSEKKVKTSAVLGGSEEIYCSGKNLYITARQIDSTENGMITIPEMSMNENTRILRVSLTGGRVKFQASGTVPGYIDNQFSMDEQGGYFRIATTSNKDGHDVNHLFVLDKMLTEIGSVRNFARDEHIEAVRYLGDLAYVITYEQTDPLFVIDLKDPADPVILGHVKITGFSTLLVPVDAEHLLGFGYGTQTGEFGEMTDGLKMALFDVSDPGEPAVADSLAMSDISSPIQYDHKALLVGPGGSYYAIPYERTRSDWVTIEDDAEEPGTTGGTEGLSEEAGTTGGTEGPAAAPGTTGGAEGTQDSGTAAAPRSDYGILVLSAKDGKLKTLADFEAKATVNRCIFIGDWIYGICADDTIQGFRMGPVEPEQAELEPTG